MRLLASSQEISVMARVRSCGSSSTSENSPKNPKELSVARSTTPRSFSNTSRASPPPVLITWICCSSSSSVICRWARASVCCSSLTSRTSKRTLPPSAGRIRASKGDSPAGVWVR